MRAVSIRWSLLWIFRLVRRGGPWDYRIQMGEEYRSLGNFHFGAVAVAFGLPPWLILRAAGWEHWWTRHSPEDWGRPWGDAPYGDHPDDHADIIKGIRYAESIRHWPRYWSRLGWRLFDIGVATVGLLIFGPIIGVLALLTLTLSGRPAFNGAWRLGRYGKPFRCWKIRTLRNDHEAILARHLAASAEAQKEWDRHAKLNQDPRVTRLGHLLRTTSLDSLPELWNLLRGDMAVFGPRAFLESECAVLDVLASDLLAVEPGFVSYYGGYGRASLTVDQRVKLDAKYARRLWKPQVKWHALTRTVWHCVARTGAG